MSNTSSPLRLSVIINNYNYDQYLRECIDSVIAQTRPADEIIFVDDGSTDNSLAIIQPYKDRIKIISQRNGGQLRAITTGAEAATGDILLFLDSDDKWKDNHLKVVESIYSSRPKLGCLFTCLDFFGNNQGPHPSNKLTHPPRIIESKLIIHYLSPFLARPTSASAFRSAPIKQVLNVFKDCEDEFEISADKVLSHGASLIGMSKLFVDECTVYYRAHESNAFYRANGRLESQKQENRHRSDLVRRHMQLAFPFKIDANAIFLEFKKNKNPRLFSIFYKKISQQIQPSEIGPNSLRSELKTEAIRLRDSKRHKTTKPRSKIAAKISKKKHQFKRVTRKLKLKLKLLAQQDYRKTKNSIVIIYTPGKVGSTSIRFSLENSLNWLPVSHVHYLTPAKLDEFRNEGKWLSSLTKSERTFDSIQSNTGKRMKIITLVRDPIARDLSGIFQSTAEHFPGIDIDQITSNDCIDLLSKTDFSYTSTWFDEEFKEYLNFDIYQQPFNKERGYQIYHEEKFDLLCLKLEQLSQVYTQAMSDFLGIQGNQLKNENQGSNKAIASIYREPKMKFKLPEKRLREIYDDKLLHTFYTNEEVEGFVQKWKA